MVDNLELHSRSARNDIARLRLVVARLRIGRGDELGRLVTYVLDQFELDLGEIDQERADVSSADVGDDFREKLLLVVSRKYERLQAPLDVLYEVLGMYEKSVDRSDVPVGLQHLIDVLMLDLLADAGDPMIHLDAVDMYSTVDLVTHLDVLFARAKVVGPGAGYAGAHPAYP
jgi:hypothetical protein